MAADAGHPVAAAGPAPPPAEQRLHPFSWLFVLSTSMRPFVLPLLLLWFVGRGSSWELWGLVGVGTVTLAALIRSLGYRYRLADGELLVREGLIFRTERHVPFARVQNVVQRRNVLHRMFGVTELRLESGGGSKPEAVMNVIAHEQAEHIRRVLRGEASAQAGPMHTETSPLVALRPGEILRLGLIVNRGWVVLGIAFAAWWQLAPEDASMTRLARDLIQRAAGAWFGMSTPSAPWFVVAVAIAAILVLIRVTSVAMALLDFHGFRLTRDEERVSSEGGLLTRHVASSRHGRIQRLVVAESWLARRFRRCTLECNVAGGGGEEAKATRRLHWLVPIGTRATVTAVIDRVAPGLRIDDRQWLPVHPQAWRRAFKVSVLIATGLCLVPIVPLRDWAPLPWVLPLLWAALITGGLLDARGSTRFAAFGFQDGVLAWRYGWLVRHWTVARVAHGHTVRFAQSPFDRRAGMASLFLDTAGADQSAFQLQLKYLPEATARELFARLRPHIGSPPGVDDPRGSTSPPRPATAAGA